MSRKAQRTKLPKLAAVILRTILFKKRPPIEIGAGVLIAGLIVGILLIPSIFATALPDAPTVSLKSSAPLLPTNSYTYDEVGFDPYTTDEMVINNEVAFTEALRQDVEKNFYISLTQGNRRIIDAVYAYARDLNKDLVFALLFEESSGKPNATHVNISTKTGEVVSIDRGLFQLNSNSYPDLSEAEAFQIETNVKYGIGHIRGELQCSGGNVKKALWAYNAGQNGILDGVPKKTLEYAIRIIANTKSIKQARELYIKQNLPRYLVVNVSYVIKQAGVNLRRTP
jgi:hypothetical protein